MAVDNSILVKIKRLRSNYDNLSSVVYQYGFEVLCANEKVSRDRWCTVLTG